MTVSSTRHGPSRSHDWKTSSLHLPAVEVLVAVNEIFTETSVECMSQVVVLTFTDRLDQAQCFDSIKIVMMMIVQSSNTYIVTM